MIDHACIRVKTDLFSQMVEFYEKILEPLEYKKLFEFPTKAAAFGTTASADFYIFASADQTHTAHIAFRAQDRDVVKKFYVMALSAGAKDNGRPDTRKQYHENYYAAFVHDPAGNNIEAVCHDPQ